MGNTLKFYSFLIVGVLGVLMGLSLLYGGNPFSGFQFGSALGASGGMANVLDAFSFSSNGGSNAFLMSFDMLKTHHVVTLNSKVRVQILDVIPDDSVNPHVIYLATTHGLFFSYDNGSSWNQFVSANNEISSDSAVLKVYPLGLTGSYILSVFSQGRGYVYRTDDNFFTLHSLIDFDNESAYDFYRVGNKLFMMISNGQILSYDLNTATIRVAYVLPSPAVHVVLAPDEFFYITLKSGAILRTQSFYGPFEKLPSPQKSFFSRSNIKQLQFDATSMYALTSEGIYKSSNSGETFEFLKDIPLPSKNITAFSVYKGTLYVYCDGRLYTSIDDGVSWKVSDLIRGVALSRFYFIGDQRVIALP